MKCAPVLLVVVRVPLVLLALACSGARADQWSVDGRLEAGSDYNDNYRLDNRPQSVSTASLGGSVGLERSNEDGQTRLAGTLSMFATRPTGLRDRADLSLDARHTLRAPHDTWSGALHMQRDSTLEQRLTASEIVIGTGERRTREASADWTHLLSERASARLGVSGSRTDYGREVAAAVNYRNAALSAGASYRVTEADSAGVQFARSQYRSASGDSRADTRSLTMSWQHAMSERNSASLSVGAYQTVSRSQHPVLVCPLPIDFCTGGVVSYIVAQRQGQARGAGAQFDASLERQLSPSNTLTFAASRQVSPSAAGSVSRNDALSLEIREAWSETLVATASASMSRSSFVGAVGAAQPRLRIFSGGLVKDLGPELSLQLSLRCTRSDDPSTGIGATAHAFGLLFRAQAPRRWSWL